MAYETIQTKKFLNSNGVGYLWEKIRARYDQKLDEVRAANDSIAVTNSNQISVVISAEENNLLQLKTTGNKGLYVAPHSADTYSIVKDADSENYAAVYKLKRYTEGSAEPVDAGTINIPKDMVVRSGSVTVKSYDDDTRWGAAGTYIELVLANADNSKIWIPVGSLIEYVTSGSQVGDMVYITIDPNTHVVTASITDGTITKAKLESSLQTALDKANSAIQSIAPGSENGSISVDGTDVSVTGLGTAAFTNSSSYDPAGAADAVLGSASDADNIATVHGVRNYAFNAYASIQALSNIEIDSAISVANDNIDG